MFSEKYAKTMLLLTLLLLLMLTITNLYNAFKPPLVPKETVDKLVNSANRLESFSKEIKEIAIENRNFIRQKDEEYKIEHENDSNDFKDLYDKYTLPPIGKIAKNISNTTNMLFFSSLQQSTKD